MTINKLITLGLLSAKMAQDSQAYTPSPSLRSWLKGFEGRVHHGGRHRVYDDKSNGRNWWDGKTPYDTWVRTIKGKPTIGHGTRVDLLPPQLATFIKDKGGIKDEMADHLLNRHLADQERKLRRMHGPQWGEMNPNQQDAIRSLYYNLGTGGNTDTLKRAIRNRRWNQIPGILPIYHKSGGKPNQGLINRRAGEVKIFNLPWRPPAPAPAPRGSDDT